MSQLYPDFTLTRDNCDREPIHRPEAIQGTGHVLALDAADPGRVLAYSDGALDILGIPADAIWTQGVTAHLPEPCRLIIERLEAGETNESMAPQPLTHGGITYDTIGSCRGSAYVLDFEDADPPEIETSDALRFDALLRSTDDPEALYDVAAQELRRQLGFDRVMVYQFDPDGHGFVVGEAKRDDLEPFLGLHYPATDIPQPARVVLQAARVRSIADIHLPNRPLHFRPDRPDGEHLDLTYSQLRATSPIHIEYLANMGVQATMTIAIEVGGALWGLFACHHYGPKNPGYHTRRLAGMESLLFSLRLQEVQAAKVERNRLASREAEEKLIGSIRFDDIHQLDLASHGSALVELCACDGAAVLSADKPPIALGETFPVEQLGALRQHLAELGAPKIFTTDHIAADLPAAFSADTEIGGLLAARVSEVGSTYFVWFRRRQRQAITWAGDPRLPHVVDRIDESGAQRLSPRQSFAKWQDAIEDRCLPWTDDVLDMAQRIRGRVLQREATFTATTMQRHNDDLRQMSYAASHDLREPLRTVGNYLELLTEDLDERLDDEQRHFLERAGAATRRMRGLVDDLLTYADVQREVAWEWVDMAALVAGIVEDLGDVIQRTGATIDVGTLPPIFGKRTNLERCFLNLITNALKYVADGVQPHVTVTGEQDADTITYRITDNGIGIAPENVAKIFAIFGRLHHHSEYTGSGMGLAICKRVVEGMHGTLEVASEPGRGSTFTCRFERRMELPT